MRFRMWEWTKVADGGEVHNFLFSAVPNQIHELIGVEPVTHLFANYR
jgi:hypothetical protein